MNKSILKTVAVSAVSAVAVMFCVGCSEKEGDDGELVGDWSVVSESEVRDGKSYVDPIPDDYKMFFSFTSSGDFAVTGFEKFGNFWVESVDDGMKVIIAGNSFCFADDEDECYNYSISGNTLTFGETHEDCDDYNGVERCYQHSTSYTAVRANIADTRSSLGSSLKSQDPALNRTEWTRQSESEYEWDRERLEFWGSYFYDSRNVYISDSYDRTWYTEGGNRLILVTVGCDRYEYGGAEDDKWERCVAKSIDETVTLEYQLFGGNLRLRPVGSTAWDEWTSYDYNKKSRAKSKKDKHSVGRFQAFRR
jgi:hypothetical protein